MGLEISDNTNSQARALDASGRTLLASSGKAPDAMKQRDSERREVTNQSLPKIVLLESERPKLDAVPNTFDQKLLQADAQFVKFEAEKQRLTKERLAAEKIDASLSQKEKGLKSDVGAANGWQRVAGYTDAAEEDRKQTSQLLKERQENTLHVDLALMSADIDLEKAHSMYKDAQILKKSGHDAEAQLLLDRATGLVRYETEEAKGLSYVNPELMRAYARKQATVADKQESASRRVDDMHHGLEIVREGSKYALTVGAPTPGVGFAVSTGASMAGDYLSAAEQVHAGDKDWDAALKEAREKAGKDALDNAQYAVAKNIGASASKIRPVAKAVEGASNVVIKQARSEDFIIDQNSAVDIMASSIEFPVGGTAGKTIVSKAAEVAGKTAVQQLKTESVGDPVALGYRTVVKEMIKSAEH